MMKALKWWLWIVGIFYVVEGGGTLLLRLGDPASGAALWTPTGEPGTLDAFAVDAVLVPGTFVSLSWLVLGVLVLWSIRSPARAGALVLAVAMLEIFAWVPVDLSTLSHGWSVGRAAALITIHLAIGIGGILALRASGVGRRQPFDP